MRDKYVNVGLRQRTLPNGRIELHVDYNHNGRRVRKSLGLYLLPGKARSVKKDNEETLAIAEVKRKAIEERINNINFGKNDIGFFDYFQKCIDGIDNPKTAESWRTTLLKLREYDNDPTIRLGEIDRDWIEGFKAFLLTSYNDSFASRKVRISSNSAYLYLTKLIACLNKAKYDGLLKYNPADGMKRIRTVEADRPYLTSEEVALLKNAECENENVKRTFLFACATGLRFGDIKNLTWSNVCDTETGLEIAIIQQKTKNLEHIPLCESAINLLGERGENSDKVFKTYTNPYTNRILSTWAIAAGIKKEITFHVSRHTYATLLLVSGADIYTTSKLMGHRKIATTQIYAKVVDQSKRDAVSRLNSLL